MLGGHTQLSTLKGAVAARIAFVSRSSYRRVVVVRCECSKSFSRYVILAATSRLGHTLSSQVVYHKRNLVFMNNLYHKIAVASVCTALGFALGTHKEAKAATINLKQPISFYAVDVNNDGLGDGTYGNISSIPVGKSPFLYPQWDGVVPEFRALYEFNIASLSLTSNTIITQAIFQTTVDSWFGGGVLFCSRSLGL
jgi:hypothetical protein